MIDFIRAIDLGALEVVHAYQTIDGVVFFAYLTELGRSSVLFGLAGALAIYLLYLRRLPDITGLAVSIIGAGATILAVKILINRPRPTQDFQAYIEMTNYSFPSAHAGISMAFYGYIAFLLLQTYSTFARRMLLYSLPILICIISFSRLYLEVHYVSDILGGFVIGGIFLWIATLARNRLL